MHKTKTQNGKRRRTIKRQRIIKGHEVEVTFHYYPGSRPKLFGIAGGSIKMSYAGNIAKTIYNRLLNEKQQKHPSAKAQRAARA